MTHDKTHEKDERGFALIAVMVLASVVLALLGAYFMITRGLRGATGSSMDSTRGFYAAEGGVNLRLNEIRGTFASYQRPVGSAPPEVAGEIPCSQPDQGSGDFACIAYRFGNRDVPTYIVEDPANPEQIVIPPGETYQNLRAQEYRYDLKSVAVRNAEHAEAILDMRARVRLVPLFQFAVFYNKDLEIAPGPAMLFDGPVHANGDLYLDAGTSLTIDGQTTAAGTIHRGRKDLDSCTGSPVLVYDPASATGLPSCGGSRVAYTDTELAPWNGWVRQGVEPVSVPAPDALGAAPGSVYFDYADLRIEMDLDAGEIDVLDAGGLEDTAATTALDGCAVLSTSTTFYNHRESTNIQMLDVDVKGLIDCIYANPVVQGGKPLDDATDGGLVWHFSVKGPASAVVNNYGIRLREADALDATDGAAPDIAGLSVVTDQALYVEGHYNRTAKKPAALLADSLNVLSEAWDDANSALDLSNRLASDTTVNAAFLAGTDNTGGADGPAGQDSGLYNGGLENYPRFHEDWNGDTLTYRGSFVSLGLPDHVDGPWDDQSYSPPIRDWGFDTDFEDAANLPPLSPRFTYTTQDLYSRDFEL